MSHAPRLLAASLAIGLCAAAPAFADLPEGGEGLTGIYAGSYVCTDGEHGVVLDLASLSARENGRGFEVKGVLGFVPVLAGADGVNASVAGSFEVYGVLYDTGRLMLRAGDWIVQPETYGAAGLNADLSQREDGLWQIAGIPADGAGQCSAFLATKVIP